jgi:ABC-type uncharacterized transport system permease subunit
MAAKAASRNRMLMILLHVAVAALYALAAWALWPKPVPVAPRAPAIAKRASISWPEMLVPAALLLHAWMAGHEFATPEGLDLSLPNAVSIVAALVALVAWASGLLRTLPVIGTLVLPVAAMASLLPAFVTNPHRFPYADEPWAALHIAVALVSYSLFLVAALQAVLLMSLEKRLRRHLPDSASTGVPPLLTLERFLFRLVTVGFVLLTLTLGSGMLFSERIFGKPMLFTHRNVLSMLGWVTFGALLWGRWRYGWRGRVALRWIVAGTVFVFLAYLGEKFVLEVLLRR